MTAALSDTTNKMNAENNVPVENVKSVAEEVVAEPTAAQNDAVAAETVELTNEQKTEEMKKHLASGRRLLLTNEFSKATDILSLASQLAGEIFGDDSEHSFEPFFYYAQALLELAKVEDQVFSNALTNMPIQEEDEATANDSIDEEQYGNPDNLTEEEREDIKQKVEEALTDEQPAEANGEGESTGTSAEVATTESEANAEAPTSETTTDAAATVTETADDTEATATEEESAADATNGDGDVAMEEGEEAGAEEEEGAEDNEDDDDESSMKLAWELFETSRRICDKKLESLAEDAIEDLKKWTLLKADVLGFLGEHGIVDGKAEQAQKDLQSALELQSQHHGETSRVLAQTNHLLAKAFRLDGGFLDAATHFEKSKNLLVARSEELKTQLESALEETKKTIEEELKELTELIPEMDVYIDDSKASAEQAAKIKETVKEELESAAAVLKNLTGAGDSAEANKEANDISGMIRRPTKRPASAQNTEEEGDAVKKAKSEELSAATTTEVPVATEESS